MGRCPFFYSGCGNFNNEDAPGKAYSQVCTQACVQACAYIYLCLCVQEKNLVGYLLIVLTAQSKGKHKLTGYDRGKQRERRQRFDSVQRDDSLGSDCQGDIINEMKSRNSVVLWLASL